MVVSGWAYGGQGHFPGGWSTPDQAFVTRGCSLGPRGRSAVSFSGELPWVPTGIPVYTHQVLGQRASIWTRIPDNGK